MLNRLIVLLVLPLIVSACGSSQTVEAPQRRTPSATSADTKNKTGQGGDALGRNGENEDINSKIEDGDKTEQDESDNLEDGIAEPDQPENGGTVTPPANISGGSWKGLLMTGDNSINAFDNARKKIKSLFTGFGVAADNLRELSMKSSEQSGFVLPTNRQNIRSALEGLNLGPNDKCIIFMTSHGSRQGFYLVGQSTMSPSEFAQILDDTCGDRPTVLLVSACYSGVFITDPVTKPNRIILTAARPDRTSFGCGTENEYTFWDNCLIDNLPAAATWNGLYDTVKACIQRKESGGGYTPSEPQGYFGSQVSTLGMFK
jgi:hypothetical protein